MRLVLIAITLALLQCQPATADSISLKIGAGVKFSELQIYSTETGEVINDANTARIEFGYESGPITIGVTHHSQWFRGYPFDDRAEYFKTELFIDYKIDWEL